MQSNDSRTFKTKILHTVSNPRFQLIHLNEKNIVLHKIFSTKYIVWFVNQKKKNKILVYLYKQIAILFIYTKNI